MIKRFYDILMCKDKDQWGNGIPIISPLFWWGIVVPFCYVLSLIEDFYYWVGRRFK